MYLLSYVQLRSGFCRYSETKLAIQPSKRYSGLHVVEFPSRRNVLVLALEGAAVVRFKDFG